MTVVSAPGPMAVFITARPNGRFIKAEATGRPDLQILGTSSNFAIIPHNQFISGRAKPFSSKIRPNGRFINARSNGRFINTRPNGPFYQGTSNRMARPADLSRKLQFRYYPAQSIYQRPGSHFQAKAGQWPFYQRQVQWPFYQRQAQWPFYQGRSDRTARKQASRFQQQLAISLLSRRINVSAAGPSYFRKSRPMDVLSTPGPMAVLTTGG